MVDQDLEDQQVRELRQIGLAAEQEGRFARRGDEGGGAHRQPRLQRLADAPLRDPGPGLRAEDLERLLDPLGLTEGGIRSGLSGGG